MQLVEDNIEALEAEFRQRLVEARKQSGMTQKDLQEKTGLSQQAISRIETGEISSSIKNLMRYLNGIGYELTVHPK